MSFEQVDSTKSEPKNQVPTTEIVQPEQIEIINPSFDALVKKLTEEKKQNPLWGILIPLLIGAGLTLLTQFVLEHFRTTKEKVRRKQELISKGRAKTYLIAQILKDLAMYKVHKQYYYRAAKLLESTGPDPEEEIKSTMNKHYEKGQEQRETESKLDDNIAEYFEMVTEYAILNGNIDEFNDQFQSIFNYEHPKSSKLTEFTDLNELVTGLQEEETRLQEEYKKLSGLFENIQTSMK